MIRRGALILAAAALAACAAAAEPTTLVIPPPHVTGGGAETRAAAALLCDRLAGALGKADGVKVVDRTQIDRVLAERKLEPAPTAALAWDAMVRVEVDADRPAPRLRVTVIDLSMGNVAGSKEYLWRAARPEEHLADVVAVCAAAAKAAADGPGGRLKVRVVDPVVGHLFSRLDPLADRLKAAFEQAVIRDGKLCLVRHLQAATAKEESLLILLGHTRLPGNRRFVPQAHATLETRLAEIDPLGKSFNETTVRLELRVEKGGPAKWQGVTGKVAGWDTVTADAWRVAAGLLAKIDPKAAEDFLRDMAVRPRQAEAEMEKLRSLGAFRYPDVDGFRAGSVAPGVLDQLIQTAAVAAKLDPTNKGAAFVHLKFSYVKRAAIARKAPLRARELFGPIMRGALRYLEQPGGPRGTRSEAADIANASIGGMLSARGVPTPPDHDTLNAMARLADLVMRVRDSLGRSLLDSGYLVKQIADAMAAAGMSETRDRWLDRSLAYLDAKVLAAHRPRGLYGRDFELTFTSLRSRRIIAALDAGRPVQARRLLVEMMAMMPHARFFRNPTRWELPASAARLKDPALVSQVKKWLAQRDSIRSTFVPMGVDWPGERLMAYPDAPVIDADPVSFRLVGGQAGLTVAYLEPIGVVGRRMYATVSMGGGYSSSLYPRGHKHFAKGVRYGVVEVDAAGRPVRAEVVQLPRPDPRLETWITFTRIIHGRLCVGTRWAGLFVYDPKTRRWRVYGPPQGLPHWRVQQALGLDGEKLLCSGGGWGGEVLFTLDLASGEVVPRRRTPLNTEHPCGVWPAGGKWLGLVRSGVIADMLSPDPAIRNWDPKTPQGWPREQVLQSAGRGGSVPPPLVMAHVAGRRFVVFPDSLREIDDRGKVLREWTTPFWPRLSKVDYTTYHLNGYYKMALPGEVPGRILLGDDGTYLYFGGPAGVACFDPANDRWYGPVKVRGAGSYTHEHAIVLPGGLWVGRGPLIPRTDIIAAAKKAGLVASSQQLRKRLDQKIAAAPPLDRAKLAFSLRRFDPARALLKEVLTAEPANVEALIVMGLLHEPHALNEPDKALPFFRLAAQRARTDPAAAAGMLLQLEWYCRENQPKKARAVARRMLNRFRLSATWHWRAQSVACRPSSKAQNGKPEK